MRTLRVAVVWTAIIAVSPSAIAGDLAVSIARAVQQQAPARPGPPRNKTLVWTGGMLFAGGMAMALYGFLAGKEGTETESLAQGRTEIGIAGLGIAALGGAVLIRADRHRPSNPSNGAPLWPGPPRVTLSTRVAW